MPTRVYDHTIAVLKAAIVEAKLGNDERLDAIRRLDAQARQLERRAAGPTFEGFIAAECRCSPAYGGRSVFGCETRPAAAEPVTATAITVTDAGAQDRQQKGQPPAGAAATAVSRPAPVMREPCPQAPAHRPAPLPAAGR